MSSLDDVAREIKETQAERTALEAKIASLREQEAACMGPRGVGARLTDSEGFPLADVDVHQVRILRHDSICAQNDYSALCKRLEGLVMKYHSLAASAHASSGGSSDDAASAAPSAVPAAASSISALERSAPAALYVRSVLDNSPAYHAQLRAGDRVLFFGPLGRDDIASDPSALAKLVQAAAAAAASAGAAESSESVIRIVVRRPLAGAAAPAPAAGGASGEPGDLLVLQLRPRAWEGRGALGCEVVPAP